ncbi:MAG: hypothetical protein FWF99_00075 [Desulfovibrionaceae bacterium]|nr:hypothetical protein [Desulfovibrionaceae bacterium]
MAKLQIEIALDEEALKAAKKAVEAKIRTATNWLVAECKKKCDSYTPMETGALQHTFQYTTKEGTRIGGSGEREQKGNEDEELRTSKNTATGWIYRSIYTLWQWYGVTKDGKPFNYSKGAALEGNLIREPRSRWTEYAAAQHKDELLKGFKAMLK